ncbi:cytoplasmic protein [Bacillus velezensis]|uniref:cytoplasmic protein n=1 Tax=Bacillus velezensis TaxID=492670 RepID=UPI003EBF8A9F
MATQQQLSPQQRAQMFTAATRQTWQMMGTKTVTEDMQTIDFNLPKVRLLSQILVEFEATVSLKSQNATIPAKTFSPYQIIRNIALELNSGFRPFVVSGEALHIYSLDRLNPDVLLPSNSQRAVSYIETAASATGKDAKIKFQVALPLTLNQRDPVGLVLLQNEETTVSLTIDTARAQDTYQLASGDTVTLKQLKVTPTIETFSIPAVKEAIPDLSVLKLVSEKGEVFSGNGQNIVKLSTGTIYRKLMFYFTDETGAPLKDTDFSGNLELVFNQADIPYSIKPSALAARNHSDLGYTLPDGVFIFDFSNQGFPNFGGSRDYIDTERLTEFWVRFNTQKAGRVKVIAEKLSRLH